MKAPGFWYKPQGIYSTLLKPLGWVYGGAAKISRSLETQRHFPVPVVSIGNLVAGGAGKTPAAIALAELLQAKGLKVHFVTRGYGGSEFGPIRVDEKKHSFKEVGDEALLLALQAPTWVAKKRPDGVQRAVEVGADIILLDDGHQTKGLYKDISFLVVNDIQKFGNGCVIPSGPLRESLNDGLKRTDAVIQMGDVDFPFEAPIFQAKTLVQPVEIPKEAEGALAFCGLGFPEKFYETLGTMGINVIQKKSFPDHYAYQEDDLIELSQAAQSQNAALVTTRKDAVKIPASWQNRLHVLDIKTHFEDTDGVFAFLCDRIPSLKEEG